MGEDSDVVSSCLYGRLIFVLDAGVVFFAGIRFVHLVCWCCPCARCTKRMPAEKQKTANAAPQAKMATATQTIKQNQAAVD